MQHNITYRGKDGSIQFIISYKDHSGRWRQKSKQGFAKVGQAKEAAGNMLDELKEKYALQLNTELEGITFGEFTAMHLEHLRLYKEHNTITAYEQAAKKFASLDGTELAKITSVHVQQCVDSMVRAGLKPSTINNHIIKIKTLLKAAISPHRIIADNPAAALKVPDSKDTAKDKALNIADVDKLLGKLKSPKKYIITLLAVKCGLRLGEIVGLTWDDVTGKGISISKQWKRRRDGSWGFGPPKSRNSHRTVPAPKSVLHALTEYKKLYPVSIDKRIVPYARTGGIGTELNSLYKRLGYDISIHDLRHTFATLLIAGGTDYRTAAQILGHNPEETMRVYAHVTSDMMDKAAKAMNDIFG